MPQYVAHPISLKFFVNEERHTVATAKKLKEEIPLPRSLKAVIGDSMDDALEKLIADAAAFTSNFPGTAPRDFQITYSMEEVKDGRFWNGGSGFKTALLGI